MIVTSSRLVNIVSTLQLSRKFGWQTDDDGGQQDESEGEEDGGQQDPAKVAREVRVWTFSALCDP